jgi:drug/metabolite transporter (DMT)-like permease
VSEALARDDRSADGATGGRSEGPKAARELGARTAPGTLTAILTCCTLLAFAANSLLARMALGNDAADPVGFTTVRLTSGALTLWLIITARGERIQRRSGGSWLSGWWLFLYAITFSWAYVSLTTGTGALILFGAVQVTMIVSGLRSGERPRALQWIGLAIALLGLVLLVAPGISAPSPLGALLMATAGAAWGLYSVRGRGVANPAAATASNFVRSVPMVALTAAVVLPSIALSSEGVLLAVVSGSLASGLGYVLWYSALRGLSTTQASIVQLAVPVLAALAGVVVLSEELTTRLVISGIVILGGVGTAVVAGSRNAPSN